MPLEELSSGTKEWHDVKYAALILWKSSQIPDANDLNNDLQNGYMDSRPTIFDIHTGINQTRKVVVVQDQETIVIAFQGSTDDEILTNLWTDGKGPNWYDFPYPVYVDGN